MSSCHNEIDSPVVVLNNDFETSSHNDSTRQRISNRVKPNIFPEAQILSLEELESPKIVPSWYCCFFF